LSSYASATACAEVGNKKGINSPIVNEDVDNNLFNFMCLIFILKVLCEYLQPKILV